MTNAIQIALSGLNAASQKIQASASNIANLSTNGALDPANGPAPYSELTTTQASVSGANGQPLGVTSDVVPTGRPFVPAYQPDSPFANADGLIGTPSSDLAGDIVNLQVASNSYKANIKVIQAQSEIEQSLLDIFDKKI